MISRFSTRQETWMKTRMLLLASFALLSFQSVAASAGPVPSGEGCGLAPWFDEVPVGVEFGDRAGIGCRLVVPVGGPGWVGEYVRRVPGHLAVAMDLDVASLELKSSAQLTVMSLYEATSYDPDLAPPPGDSLLRIVLVAPRMSPPSGAFRVRLDWNGDGPFSIENEILVASETARIELRLDRDSGAEGSGGQIVVQANGQRWITAGDIDLDDAFVDGEDVNLDPAALVRVGNLGYVGGSSDGEVVFWPTGIEFGWGEP
jgi:hypothetical protein